MDSLLAIASGKFDPENTFHLQGRLYGVEARFEDLLHLAAQRKMSADCNHPRAAQVRIRRLLASQWMAYRVDKRR